jgi:glutamate/tyrosine decarboxylase-like PLP-dependent enzyme
MNPLEISPEQFHDIVLEVGELATDFLRSLDTTRAYPEVTGAQTAQTFGGPAPEEGLGSESLAALTNVLALCRPPTGRFFGYVLGSGDPVGAAADLLASVMNNNVTAWRSSPSAVAIEQTVVKWIATAIGCKSFHGSLCGGGSSANLMALTMAREAKFPANETGAQPAIVYASTEVHMSMPKALAMLGLGRQNLRLIPVDADFHMNLNALRETITTDQRAGKRAIAIVANAGTVNTGAIDDFTAIAQIAHENNLWFHIDGAYGALAALAAPEKFKSIELADSLSLDPHKWLYQPLDCGMLLYRDPAIARQTFAYSGDYTKVLNADPIESYAFFEESIELSRRFRALKLWLSIRYHGLAAFRAAIQNDLDHAQLLADLIRPEPKLELLAPVTLSAVCFRAKAPEGSDANDFNTAILKRLISRGRVYLSNATIRGHFALRACFVNHRTTDNDVISIIKEVLEASEEVRASATQSRSDGTI